MKREQRCWFFDGRAILFIKQTIFVWKWRCIDFSLSSRQTFALCLSGFANSKVWLHSLDWYALDKWPWLFQHLTWMRPSIQQKMYLSFFIFFFFYTSCGSCLKKRLYKVSHQGKKNLLSLRLRHPTALFFVVFCHIFLLKIYFPFMQMYVTVIYNLSASEMKGDLFVNVVRQWGRK